MCRVLEVSASGYYAWASRSPSRHAQEDVALGERIETIFRRSRSTYGRPRIHAELGDDGSRVGAKRVARFMRNRSIQKASRRNTTTTTIRDHDALSAADLVEQRFVANAPNQLWVADITFIPTWGGFLYLVVVLDVFSRRVGGWAMADTMRKALVIEALDMAIYRRKPLAAIYHSDKRSHYTSIAFGLRCKAAGVRLSMGSRGDCYDNAMCESFNATLECELLVEHRFRTLRAAEAAVFDFIEAWYDPHRHHSAIDYLSLMNFERRAQEAA